MRRETHWTARPCSWTHRPRLRPQRHSFEIQSPPSRVWSIESSTVARRPPAPQRTTIILTRPPILRLVPWPRHTHPRCSSPDQQHCATATAPTMVKPRTDGTKSLAGRPTSTAAHRPRLVTRTRTKTLRRPRTSGTLPTTTTTNPRTRVSDRQHRLSPRRRRKHQHRRRLLPSTKATITLRVSHQATTHPRRPPSAASPTPTQSTSRRTYRSMDLATSRARRPRHSQSQIELFLDCFQNNYFIVNKFKITKL